MTELYPPDATLNALSGSADPEQEVLFIPTGQSPYYTSFYKMLHRLLAVARRAGDLRVYKDGPLTFGVRAGRFCDGPANVDYAGSTGNALANTAVNSVYLTPAGVLTVSQSGFPAAGATPHIPLATITTGGGDYGHEAVIDCRGRSLYGPVTAQTAADGNRLHDLAAPAATQTLTAGGFTIAHGNKPVVLLTVNAASDLASSAVTAVAAGSALGQRLTIVVAASTGDAGRLVTIRNAAGTRLAGDWARASGSGLVGCFLELAWDGSAWVETGRDRGAGAVGSGESAMAAGNSWAAGVCALAAGSGSTASGYHSAALNGATATKHAAFASGYSKAVAPFAHATGYFAQADAFGKSALASHGGDWGANQATRMTVRAATTGATGAELTADGNAPGTITMPGSGDAFTNRVPLADATTYAFTVTIAARQDTGANSALFKRMALLSRTSGTVSLVGAVGTLGTDINPDAWAVALAPDDTNKCLKITVTGKAATNIHWVALVEAVEIRY